MFLLQISDDNIGKVIDHTFAINPSTVFGSLVGILLIIMFFMSRSIKSKEDDLKESYNRNYEQTKSYAETFAQMNGHLQALHGIQDDVSDIKNHITR